MLKLHHVLVPTDLSDESAVGLRVGAGLAGRSEAKLSVLHVETGTPVLAYALAGSGQTLDAEEIGRDHLARARERVEEFVKKTLGEGHGATVTVVDDMFVAETIDRFARERGCDCICMSVSGRKGFLVGATTSAVVRSAPVPVLTLRGNPPAHLGEKFQRVLASVDLGERSKEIVRIAAGLARPEGKLILAHVIESPNELGLYGSPLQFPAEDLAAAKEWSEIALQKLGQGIEDRLLEPVQVRTGRTVDEILDLVQEIQPDVLVLGTHGRHGLERLELGSVAERVLQRAACPTFTVPLGKGIRS